MGEQDGADAPGSEAWTPSSLVVWGRERADDLTDLLDAAASAEQLTTDELLGCCWDDPDEQVVLATPDGAAAVGVVVRRWGTPPEDLAVAFVTVLAVHPDHRRQGRGRALLAAAEQWARQRGAVELQVGGSAPFYLWPAVDAADTGLACLLEATAYRRSGMAVDMALPSSFRSPAPEGVEVRRVTADADVAAVAALLDRQWPEWRPEADRAVDAACCHGAFTADGTAVGFCCHSVNRAGVLGPMGTDPARQRGGVGAALVGEVCRDLMVAGYDDVQIAWVGPVRFYAKLGATISRVYRGARRALR